MATASIDDRATELLEFAKAQAKTAKHWGELHNAVYGVGALLSQLFPTNEEREQYAQTEQHEEVRKLIESLPPVPTK